MARTRRPAMLLVAVALSALLLAGCTVNGGGWINSSTGAKKATFGFTWAGEDCEPAYVGQIGIVLVCDPTHAKGFWSDGSVKFRIAEGGLTVLFFDFVDACWLGEGTYVPTGPNPDPGDIEIELCDRGEPGASSQDYVAVELTDGTHDGYSNSGNLQGGNLQASKPPNIGP
jgi:predicted small secreted protein